MQEWITALEAEIQTAKKRAAKSKAKEEAKAKAKRAAAADAQKRAQAAEVAKWRDVLKGSGGPPADPDGSSSDEASSGESEPESPDAVAARLEAEARRKKKEKNKRKKERQRSKRRDSAESVSTVGSAISERDDGALKGGGWGMRSVKPVCIASLLSTFVKKSPRPVEMLVGANDGYLGLQFIDYVTSSGARSLASWVETQFEKEMAIIHGAAFATKPPREVHELRFLAFVLDLALQDAEFVEQTVSGASMVADVLARRLFASYQVLAGEMSWSIAERVLPVGAVKRVPGVQAAKLFGMVKELKRGEKAKAVLHGEAAGPKATPLNPKGSV